MLIVGDSYRTTASTVVKSLFQQNFMSTFYYFMGFGQWLFWWMPRVPPAAGRLAADSSCSVDSCLAPGQRNVKIQSPPSIWTSWRMPQPVPSCRLPPTPASLVPPTGDPQSLPLEPACGQCYRQSQAEQRPCRPSGGTE